MKDLNKSIKKCIRDKKKTEKTTRNPKHSRRLQRCQQHPRNQNCKKKKVLITKMKNERGEIITSRTGIADVFGEFYENLYGDNEQDEYGNESNIDVHNNDTE